MFLPIKRNDFGVNTLPKVAIYLNGYDVRKHASLIDLFCISGHKFFSIKLIDCPRYF